MSDNNNKVICEVLIEMELIIKENSSRDQVAQLIHQHLQIMKKFPEDFPFKVDKVTADYGFSVPGEDGDDSNDLTKDPDDMMKV
jgi:hypothetical protein